MSDSVPPAELVDAAPLVNTRFILMVFFPSVADATSAQA
jgi:hypothetical protein